MKEYIAEEIRKACIQNNWYTCGTCAEYDAMFEMVYGGTAIMDIANDIWAHSDPANCSCSGAVYAVVSEIVKKARRIWTTEE